LKGEASVGCHVTITKKKQQKNRHGHWASNAAPKKKNQGGFTNEICQKSTSKVRQGEKPSMVPENQSKKHHEARNLSNLVKREGTKKAGQQTAGPER